MPAILGELRVIGHEQARRQECASRPDPGEDFRCLPYFIEVRDRFNMIWPRRERRAAIRKALCFKGTALVEVNLGLSEFAPFRT